MYLDFRRLKLFVQVWQIDADFKENVSNTTLQRNYASKYFYFTRDNRIELFNDNDRSVWQQKQIFLTHH
jgi:hypothetical protein